MKLPNNKFIRITYLLPLPTVIEIAPPRPDEARPVPIEMAPLLPLLAVPVDMITIPLTPAAPALAVCRSIVPEVEVVLKPVVREI